MGCGTSKVLPETPKNCYVDFVKSVVKCNNKQKLCDEEPLKPSGKRNDFWGIYNPGEYQQQQQQNQHLLWQEGVKRNKIAKYRAKFDSRVTARYDIKALIGRGSFSRVVRVEHRATKQPFAIKMIETKAKEGREVCESELRVLRRVSHCNIIQLIEVLESQERVYMVMELATEGAFDRIIAKGSFTERDATQVLQMVLDGVKYLHSLGISHRDLKPENLLYYHPGTDSKILVTDFGLANSGNKGGDWSMRTTCGTPEYIAPEILLRKPYTSAVDMWALGVITYILLSGSMPFEDENRTRLYRMILKGKYSFVGDPWPSVSNLAKDYINRLLTVDPSERMTATQALKHPWIVTMAASSSMKNLHRSISQNLMRRASSRCQSSKSGQSSRSNRSRRIWEKEILERNLKYQPHYEQQ
ncbi:serine/threonine-protein kinase H1-like [Acipenser oxyrinchus oxyrinchus]|uniref:Serine/threonine-protein kinase H1-like n=1 Tax=Acipenser oxyrinchus oxyrinchus TaxID=40147 RepID=A0AAD8GDA9_ACIOX|nr:serine/threonine-protein kinase H1-like [Acipenser oxyrinchus oxyrinchus]